jgi:hypothetical protein
MSLINAQSLFAIFAYPSPLPAHDVADDSRGWEKMMLDRQGLVQQRVLSPNSLQFAELRIFVYNTISDNRKVLHQQYQ